MIRGILSLILAASASVASAETLALRSGEHSGFSRLVFEADADWSWEIDQTEAGYVLSFTGADIPQDLSHVFNRIPRSRLSEIAAVGPNSIQLDLACECHAKAYEISPGKLVIDVADGPAPPGPETQETRQVIKPLDLVLPLMELPKPPPEPVPQMKPDLAVLRHSLVQELGRASMQGLVIPPKQVKVSPPAPTEAAIPVAPIETTEQDIGLSIETSVDRATPRWEPAGAQDSDQACISDEEFDFSGWLGGLRPDQKLGDARRSLVQEFDAVTPENAASLVKTYLAIGFGAEARQVLETFSPHDEKAPLYRELARLVDLDISDQETMFAGQQACAGRVALWAVLAQPNLTKSDGIATDHVVQAFSELPPHLRSQFLTEVTDRFFAIDDLETAARLQNAVQRNTEDDSEALRMSQARFQVASGDPESGAETFRKAISQPGEIGPLAHIEYLELGLKHGHPPSPSELTALAAYAVEYRGYPLADRANRLLAIGFAYAGAIEQAIEVLQTTQQPSNVVNQTALVAAQHTPDPKFLIVGPALFEQQYKTHLTQETIYALAQRFSDLGFHSIAELGLEGAERTDDVRVLQAWIALQKGELDTALQLTANLRSADVTQIRVRAYERAGEYAKAIEAAEGTLPDETVAGLSWVASDWDRARESQDQAKSRYATLKLSESQTHTNSKPLPMARETLGLNENRIQALADLVK